MSEENLYGGTPVEVNLYGGTPTESNLYGGTPEPKKPMKVSLYQGRGMPRANPEMENKGIDKNPIGTLREFAQGGSWGAVQEAEALVRAGVDTLQTGAVFSPDKYYADIQKERAKYKSDNPWVATGLEVMGGIMSGGALMRAVGMGTHVGSAMVRQTGAAAVESGFSFSGSNRD